MPTSIPPAPKRQTNVVPSSVSSINVSNVDPTVQRALQLQTEAINKILQYLNRTFGAG